MWYKGLYNTWSIQGYGYADADYGEKLLHHIRGCGAVTSWKFQYYDAPQAGPGSGTYEWRASGKLPIGFQQWECIGSAMGDASNGLAGGCSGQ